MYSIDVLHPDTTLTAAVWETIWLDPRSGWNAAYGDDEDDFLAALGEKAGTHIALGHFMANHKPSVLWRPKVVQGLFDAAARHAIGRAFVDDVLESASAQCLKRARLALRAWIDEQFSGSPAEGLEYDRDYLNDDENK